MHFLSRQCLLQGKQAEAAGATPQQLARVLVGERLWIKWPYMQEALVQAVSDAAGKVSSAQLSSSPEIFHQPPVSDVHM